MPVNAKHLATFILGAAAGFAAAKYASMSEEEKEEMMRKLKAKARAFKDEAEGAASKAKDYFEELRKKGGDEMKQYMAEAEKMVNDLFSKKPTT